MSDDPTPFTMSFGFLAVKAPGHIALVVIGQPATVKRTRNNFVAKRLNAMLYHWNALAYARGDHRAWTGAAYEAHMSAVKREIEAMFDTLYGDDPLEDEAGPLI